MMILTCLISTHIIKTERKKIALLCVNNVHTNQADKHKSI